jgi:hypothetical protein
MIATGEKINYIQAMTEIKHLHALAEAEAIAYQALIKLG